ncbi:MAG: hypothetical protein JWQ34_2618 [Mucilaginibacter sp.]|uniref:hypothetical protein n=1 Tax=Mucilaginibacter sp. TaxID=1882438 RepID=UPI002626BE2B|nr:hypothetical protein [Mucilaginibacter sp.]MDB5004393.1 hypothetical protein [Mucilaginibacter sp.]
MSTKPQNFRKAVRQNIKTVIDYIDRNYVLRENDKAITPSKDLICMFCGRDQSITKEHIIPRWAFVKDTKAFFTVTLNGLHQTYNKATIPACSQCNSDLLNDQERLLQQLFTGRDVKKEPFYWDGIQEIIRWLELIDYKFQIYNITRRFRASKKVGKIDYLVDFPLYMLLPNKDYTPFQVLSAIRRSLKRLSVAKKHKHLNSLVVFKSINKGFHFFHTIDEYIFLELPQYQIALFYFFNEEFGTVKEAHNQAMSIIKKVY